MFIVIRTEKDGTTREYKSVQLKIARRQMNAFQTSKDVVALAIEHRTKRKSYIVETWEIK